MRRGLSTPKQAGSSPLTRGKLIVVWTPASSSGLIPAHAGKTPPRKRPLTSTWAHPRSRGENVLGTVTGTINGGSSPLTRGKPIEPLLPTIAQRLIPAHAGKTTPHSRRGPRCGAHPRSRGENRHTRPGLEDRVGSSPLTRGKRFGEEEIAGGEGLIPAHAGKTSRRSSTDRDNGAHPRSRGENAGQSDPHRVHGGSSPLTRGKHAPTG